MAFFEGLIETEDGLPVGVAYVGGASHYVVDDHGFKRHIEAAEIDRIVLAQFLDQLQANRDEASKVMLRMMGQDDLFAKAAVDATIRNISLDQVLQQQLPPEARQWLSMLGFRIVIDIHGEIVRLDLPTAPEGGPDGAPGAGWDDE